MYGHVLLAGEDEAGRDLRARLTGALLASDMAAFKAANPGACFEDLVRWLSPRDWTAGSTEGGALSLRMAQKVCLQSCNVSYTLHRR